MRCEGRVEAPARGVDTAKAARSGAERPPCRARPAPHPPARGTAAARHSLRARGAAHAGSLPGSGAGGGGRGWAVGAPFCGASRRDGWAGRKRRWVSMHVEPTRRLALPHSAPVIGVGSASPLGTHRMDSRVKPPARVVRRACRLEAVAGSRGGRTHESPQRAGRRCAVCTRPPRVGSGGGVGAVVGEVAARGRGARGGGGGGIGAREVEEGGMARWWGGERVGGWRWRVRA